MLVGVLLDVVRVERGAVVAFVAGVVEAPMIWVTPEKGAVVVLAVDKSVVPSVCFVPLTCSSLLELWTRLLIAYSTCSGEAWKVDSSPAFGVPQTKRWSQRLLQIPSSFPDKPEAAQSLRQS